MRARVRAALRVDGDRSKLPTDAAQLGQILGVLGVKGGVGASTVAINIALSLARQGLKIIWIIWPNCDHD